MLTACALLAGTAVPAAAAELMRVTFVRHGQSLGNASGSIDSSTPGPVLSELGYQQAEAVAGRLGDKNFDGVYASSMVRTQLTAAPMSRYLGLPIVVLPGLQEIEAGIYEGTPESEASSGYMLAPLAWGLQGNLDARIPGSIDGHEFDARMKGALKEIYDSGDRNAVVFSHGAAMMFWTFMNVDNLTSAQKMELLRASLRNTADVVIEGNAEDGWTLISWDGREFSQQRTFGAEIKLHQRTLRQQLKAVSQSIRAAFASKDPATIATALNQGISEAKFSMIKYQRAVRAELIERIGKARSTATSQTAVTATTSAAGVQTAGATAAAPATDNEEPVADKVSRKRDSSARDDQRRPTVSGDSSSEVEDVVDSAAADDRDESSREADEAAEAESDISAEESGTESNEKSDAESDEESDSESDEKSDAESAADSDRDTVSSDS
ncbi:histidine phosphatase family protein [Mycolicibacterium parafortuitum]|uniref:histidine phosphatase family protein n=1 Tax=Mycolicibacterium parafortuitum TaxID=39692 RepID=UPI0032C497D3